ncbi:MAG: YicC family protein, partial [Ruminococcus sp.]|nr:YicC family protein [Candidatus Apopatosoma intestinale]
MNEYALGKVRYSMIRSMTAYGRAKKQLGGRDILVEIRSVNNRYLDCTVKTSKLFGFLEERAKNYIMAKGISRGKVDVYIGVDVLESGGVEIELDTAYAESYLNALKKLGETFGLTNDITLMRVAQNHEVFSVKKADEDIEAEWQNVLPVLDEALDAFLAERAREGENMRADIAEKKARVMALAAEIAPLSREDVEKQFASLSERIRALAGEIPLDENRLLTECGIYADKIAIDEELVRLDSHFKAFDEILASGEPVGRKLDFLLQEINRETNTIGSKCCDSRIAKLVIEMKSELEKIREQIQNIE